MTESSVTAALSKVMEALPAIGKDQQAAPQQGGYSYRGIEAIAAHVQPLFAQHGIVMAPRVESAEVVDITVANKPWTDTRLMVAYDVYGPAGDKITVGPILGIGRDNSDKGSNKALTQAWKYALIQLLCISDAKDDTDGQTHEADAPPARPVLDFPTQERFEKAWKDQGLDPADVVRRATAGRTDRTSELYADEAAAAREAAHALKDEEPFTRDGRPIRTSPARDFGAHR